MRKEDGFSKVNPIHICLEKGCVGKYAFLPGSVERVEKIASLMKDARVVSRHREFYAMTGLIEDEPVTVISTGIGGPSTSITMEELYGLGVHTMVRVGSAASASPECRIGDVLIPSGAVKMEGTSEWYTPTEYPAIPDYLTFRAFVEAAEELEFPYNTGVTITKDSFYTEASPETKPVYQYLKYIWDAYEKAGATNTSMECALIFSIGAMLGARTASVMINATNYHAYSNDIEDYPKDWEMRAIKVAIKGMGKIILRDRKNGESI